MECEHAISFIVEAARAGEPMPGMVQAHLARCPACAARAEMEYELSSHFGLMRSATAGKRSSGQSREELMRQFSSRHWRLVHPAWGIGLAAAAALLIIAGMARGPLVHTRHGGAPPAVGAWLASGSWSVEPSADVYSTQDEGYVPVPYAPPLAPGERLSVMHAELYPAALTSLGVSVDPMEMAASGSATIHADVVVGEDGLPRAVRIDGSGRQDGLDF